MWQYPNPAGSLLKSWHPRSSKKTAISLDLERLVKVFLPPGYAHSGKSYPVVYYCHNNASGLEQLFENGNLVKLLKRGFAEGIAGKFIFVAADYSTSTGGVSTKI
jgi:hypothetical protein